ncbi:MAG: response regulator transcription factor [bacterium]
METTVQPHRPRTLIVDNSPIFLRCLQRLLDVQGIVQVVGTVSDGRTAIDMALKLAPELVLMDLLMPDLDGLQTTMLLRQQVPDSRIIIMTATENSSLSSYCRAHGAHGFVSKHHVINTLGTEIRRIFPPRPGQQN